MRSTIGHVWRCMRSAEQTASRIGPVSSVASQPCRNDCCACVPVGEPGSRRSNSLSCAPGNASRVAEGMPFNRAAPAGARNAVALQTCRSHAMQLSATAFSCEITRTSASLCCSSMLSILASSLNCDTVAANSSSASVNRSKTNDSNSCTASR